MAEQGLARQMMAQRLMTERRDDPFSDSRFFSGRIRPSMQDMADPTRFSDMAGPAYTTGATASLFAPGAGVVDIFGGAPDPMQPGQMLPSFGQNVTQGNYLDAGLQALGGAGDVMMAAGAVIPPALPAATMLATALKAPRAARVAGQAADAAKIDPNQAAGAAMDLAQARYFETGQFEAPTAENPVSVVLPTETEPGIIAFHGSGADFDEFRLEMIGTGEGAQAYGYGLYFTDSEDIAKFYKDALGSGNLVLPSGQTVRTTNLGDMAVVEDALPSELEQLGVINQAPDGTARYNKPSVLIAEAIGEAGSDDLVGNTRKYLETKLETESSFERQKLGFTKAESDALEQANINALAAFDRMIEAGIETKTGKIYKVALSPKPDELLDYDLPLNQQPKFFDTLKPLYEEYGVAETADIGTLFESIRNQRGISAQSLSERLSAAGIPGIKYRAAGSRGAGTTDEAAERNYVIFDDKAVKILEKYGIIGPVLVTGGAVAATQRGGDEEGSIFPDA
jgi:hypothetical protein